jgi:hypothetical protein
MEETWHHRYGKVWRWQHHAVVMFFSGITGRLVRIEGQMNGAKYRKILDENPIEHLWRPEISCAAMLPIQPDRA